MDQAGFKPEVSKKLIPENLRKISDPRDSSGGISISSLQFWRANAQSCRVSYTLARERLRIGPGVESSTRLSLAARLWQAVQTVVCGVSRTRDLRLQGALTHNPVSTSLVFVRRKEESCRSLSKAAASATSRW